MLFRFSILEVSDRIVIVCNLNNLVTSNWFYLFYVSNIRKSVCNQMLNEKHVVIFHCDLRWCGYVPSRTLTSAALSRYFRYAPFWSYFLNNFVNFIARELQFLVFYSTVPILPTHRVIFFYFDVIFCGREVIIYYDIWFFCGCFKYIIQFFLSKSRNQFFFSVSCCIMVPVM